MEAAAAVARTINPDRVDASAEAPPAVAGEGADPTSLLQTGVATEDVTLLLWMKVELMHL